MIADDRTKSRILSRVGQALEAARGERSVAEVKAATGMSAGQIGEAERGLRNVTLINALALRAATGLDLNALADELAPFLLRER